MTSVICRHKFSHTLFSYHEDTNTATAEESTLQGHLGNRRDRLPHSRVWNDSYDEGFILIGKDGKETIWTLATVDYNGDYSEGEIAGWRYGPYIQDWDNASQKLKDLRILIIND